MSATDRAAEDYLPLNPRVLSLMVVLLHGPAHGYSIKQSVEARSNGRVTLDPGSLYRMISKLVDDRLIEETEEGREEGDDPRRRYYRLTELGKAVAAAETGRLEQLVAHARPRLGKATS